MATRSTAGYEASGRDFRYISATITVPDTSFLTGLYPQEYIQMSNGSLGSGDQYVRAGIEACVVAKSLDPSVTCAPGSWVSYVEAFNNSLNGPYFAHYAGLSGVSQGDGVNFSIYSDEQGNELHFVITPPSTSGPVESYKTQAYGPIFDHAAAVDDFTDSTGTPIALPPFVHSFRINQFLQGAITTENGQRGSFVGPWTITPIDATSNGLPYPSGTVRVSPGRLWTSNLPANGATRPWDSFGVWAR
ncbi:MAG TPA: hypothetical protein VMH35_08200 [Streptosporangiaceae bacterium]|nr:hypothetical protein [Streptosporangiaceae bacterium]